MSHVNHGFPSHHPFNPEFCFETPIGKVCFPILSSPTFPGPPANVPVPGLERWRLVRATDGEITAAFAPCEDGALEFSAESVVTEQHRRRELAFTSGGKRFLSVNAEVDNHGRRELRKKRRSIRVGFKAAQLDYTIEIASEDMAEARLTRTVNGERSEETLDLLDPAALGRAKSCTSPLDADLTGRLEPFEPLLLGVAQHYWGRARRELGGISVVAPSEPGATASIWCGIARAGCWGLAAAGGAACCLGTATIGCVLCAGGFGAGGSACSEAWSWC